MPADLDSASLPPPPSLTAGRELAWVILFALALLAFNLLTADGFPVLLDDDVLLTDAGVNLYLGHGFTSSAWPGQSSSEFFSGNMPLYPLVLAGWFRLVGFGHLQMRAVPYLCASAAALCLWWSVRKLGWIHTARLRLVFIAIAFLSWPVALAYRHCRYDSWQLLLCTVTLALWASDLKSRAKATALLLAGAMIGASGLQTAAFVGILCLGGLLWRRHPSTAHLFAVLGGLGLGAATVLALFLCHGTLHGLLANMAWGRRIDGGTPEAIHAARVRRLFTHTLHDFGLLACIAVLLIPFFQASSWRDRDLRRLAAWALGLTAAIMLGLEFAVHFPLYYRWMSLVPIALFASRAWEASSPKLTPARRRLSLALLLSVGAGFPVTYTLATLLIPYAPEFRDLQAVVPSCLRPDDVAFSECYAYTVVKPLVSMVYFPGYLERLTPEERASITVLILRDRKGPQVQKTYLSGYLEPFALDRRWVPVATVQPRRTFLAKQIARYFPDFVERMEVNSAVTEASVFRPAP